MTKFLTAMFIAIIVVALVCGLTLREGRTGDVSKAYNEADQKVLEAGYELCRMAFGANGTMPNAEHLQICFAQAKGK